MTARIEKIKVFDRDSPAAVWSTKVVLDATGEFHELVAVAKNVWGGNSPGDGALLKFDRNGKQVAEFRQTFKDNYASAVVESHGTTLLVFTFFTQPAALVFVRPGQVDVVRRVSLELHGNPESHGCLALRGNPAGEDVPAFYLWGIKQRESAGSTYVQQWWSASGSLLKEEVYRKVEPNRMPPPNYLTKAGVVVAWPHWQKTRVIEPHAYEARTGMLVCKIPLSAPLLDSVAHRAVEFSNREIGFFYKASVGNRLETLAWSGEADAPLSAGLASGTRCVFVFKQGQNDLFPHHILPLLTTDDGCVRERRIVVFGNKTVRVLRLDAAESSDRRDQKSSSSSSQGTLAVLHTIELFEDDKQAFRYRTTPQVGFTPSINDEVIFYAIRKDTDLYRCRLLLPEPNLREAGVEATVDSVLCGLAKSLPGELYDRVADALLHRLKVARKNKQHTSA